jgi:SAM-dependent methyltransferase
MNEASKTYKYYSELLNTYLLDPILDIGPGRDKIRESAIGFDVEDGDAQFIDNYISEKFQCVFSSHCLEHMVDPQDALRRWAKLVNKGGHLIIVVPDEDLYEQGHFPSIFNSDHKSTFTLSKAQSWSPTSVNVNEIANWLPNFSIVYCALQDNGYRRELQSFKLPRIDMSKVHNRIIVKLLNVFPLLTKRFGWKDFSIDQTLSDDVLAQILVIFKKEED